MSTFTWPTNGGGSGTPVIISISTSPVTTDGTTTISFGSTALGLINILYVASNGGIVTMTANPQFPPGVVDGSMLIVFGTSDTNSVIFVDGNGNSQNGNALLNANGAIEYIWDMTAALWREVARRQ